MTGDPESAPTNLKEVIHRKTSNPAASSESAGLLHQAVLVVNAVEGGEVVSIELVDDLTPTAEAFAADPVSCDPAVCTSEFLGRMVDDPVDQFEGVARVRIPQELPPECRKYSLRSSEGWIPLRCAADRRDSAVFCQNVSQTFGRS